MLLLALLRSLSIPQLHLVLLLLHPQLPRHVSFLFFPLALTLFAPLLPLSEAFHQLAGLLLLPLNALGLLVTALIAHLQGLLHSHEIGLFTPFNLLSRLLQHLVLLELAVKAEFYGSLVHLLFLHQVLLAGF